MNVFDNWRLKEEMSTMRRLQDENARLRRQIKIRDWISAFAWIAAMLVIVAWSAHRHYGDDLLNSFLLWWRA